MSRRSSSHSFLPPVFTDGTKIASMYIEIELRRYRYLLVLQTVFYDSDAHTLRYARQDTRQSRDFTISYGMGRLQIFCTIRLPSNQAERFWRHTRSRLERSQTRKLIT